LYMSILCKFHVGLTESSLKWLIELDVSKWNKDWVGWCENYMCFTCIVYSNGRFHLTLLETTWYLCGDYSEMLYSIQKTWSLHMISLLKYSILCQFQLESTWSQHSNYWVHIDPMGFCWDLWLGVR
jgi:hypothetical protein